MQNNKTELSVINVYVHIYISSEQHGIIRLFFPFRNTTLYTLVNTGHEVEIRRDECAPHTLLDLYT